MAICNFKSRITERVMAGNTDNDWIVSSELGCDILFDLNTCEYTICHPNGNIGFLPIDDNTSMRSEIEMLSTMKPTKYILGLV